MKDDRSIREHPVVCKRIRAFCTSFENDAIKIVLREISGL